MSSTVSGFVNFFNVKKQKLCTIAILFISRTVIALKQMSDVNTDPYSIKWNFNNSIEFRGQKIYFPFYAYDIFCKLTKLREGLLNVNVCATDLQRFPADIFEDTNLKNYPDLSKWVNNIIETWVQSVEFAIHKGKKARLFNSFILLCNEKALAAKSLPENKSELLMPVNIIDGENDFIRSTIEEYLEDVREEFINPKDFTQAVNILERYFKDQPFEIPTPIETKYGSKKKLARALYKIYKPVGRQKLSLDFLQLIKNIFGVFKDEKININNITESNLYKYLTTKT